MATNPCDCGALKPAQGEKPIPLDATAEQVLAKTQLLCDDDTGVFFFRYKQRLYMRRVECSE